MAPISAHFRQISMNGRLDLCSLRRGVARPCPGATNAPLRDAVVCRRLQDIAPICCVDFDNAFSQLRQLPPDAAGQFARHPFEWIG